jgi:hypothetical protein
VDFTLDSGNCNSGSAIWLSFGGDVETRKPGVDLEVDGVKYSLKKNEDFRRLYSLITIRRQKKAAYQVTGTLIGKFLAGKKIEGADHRTHFMGYGHISCCSLFVISEVMDVVSVPGAKSDLGGTVTSPSGKPLKDVRVVSETVAVCCLPQESQSTTTDAAGHFRLSNPGQVLRFEHASFRPVMVVLNPGESEVSVVLGESKKPEWRVPTCDGLGAGQNRIGFVALFRLSTELHFEKLEDESIPGYFVSLVASPLDSALNIASDGDGLRSASDSALSSKSFEQRWIKDKTGAIVGVDSRGQFKWGDYWRSAKFLGHDVASYGASTIRTARIFDQAIDSVCIQKP